MGRKYDHHAVAVSPVAENSEGAIIEIAGAINVAAIRRNIQASNKGIGSLQALVLAHAF